MPGARPSPSEDEKKRHPAWEGRERSASTHPADAPEGEPTEAGRTSSREREAQEIQTTEADQLTIERPRHQNTQAHE